MNDGLIDGFCYNSWATRERLAVCRTLTEEQLNSTAVGAYGSIIDTMRHIVSSEDIDSSGDSLDDLDRRVNALEACWERFLSTPFDAEQVFPINWLDGRVRNVPAGILATGVLHHGIEHRSRIGTSLASPGLPHPTAARMTSGSNPDRVILVEGSSDRIAIDTVAMRLGIDLASESIQIVEMGGASSIGAYLDRFSPVIRLAGLYDANEASIVARSLARAGFGSPATPEELEALGFFMCTNDLEGELIRAVGVEAIEEIVRAAGDARPFSTFRRQPEWRNRPLDAQFHRFLGSGARRKIRYAAYLTEAADLTHLPQPLLGVLDYVRTS